MERKEVEFIGFGYRLGASLLDALLVSLASGLIVWVAAGLQMPDFEEKLGFLVALVLPVPPLFVLGFWLWRSATPGKLAVNSRIVDFRTGKKPKLWQLLVRFLGYSVSAAPFFAGFLCIIWDKDRRGYHDYMSRTAVIGDAGLRPLTPEERKDSRVCIKPPPPGWES